MNKFVAISFLISSCSSQDKKDNDVSLPYSFTDNERAVFEGKWNTNEGVLRIELSLQTAAPGVDAQFELTEIMESAHMGSGALSRGKYTILYGQKNNEVVIRLNNLPPNKLITPHFRQLKSWLFDSNEEMYFVSRGAGELLPCDRDFRVYSAERRFALHKRSNTFTVEGYITFVLDSAEFFERNTGQRWNVSDLGEYDSLQIVYNQMVKEQFEGIYLKALAYTVSDSASINYGKSLVIKRILTMGNDPD